MSKPKTWFINKSIGSGGDVIKELSDLHYPERYFEVVEKTEFDKYVTEVERMYLHNSQLNAANAHLSMVDHRAIGDIMMENRKLKVEISRVSDIMMENRKLKVEISRVSDIMMENRKLKAELSMANEMLYEANGMADMDKATFLRKVTIAERLAKAAEGVMTQFQYHGASLDNLQKILTQWREYAPSKTTKT